MSVGTHSIIQDIFNSHSDWERVIIIHSRDGNNMWAPSRALLSSHSGYHNLAWGDIQNTLTTEEIEAGDANDPNGVRNNDHPKVYISWSKHAHFDTRNTGWVDPISQSTDNAFRSNDWWHYVDKKYYVSILKHGSPGCFDSYERRSYRIILPTPAKLWEVLTGAVPPVTPLMCRNLFVLPKILDCVTDMFGIVHVNRLDRRFT